MKGEVKMPKIKAVKFIEHPVLGNLELNFCDASGNPVDTVIFAGENGVGKSTVLQSLYNIVCGQIKEEAGLGIIADTGLSSILLFFDSGKHQGKPKTHHIWI